MNERRKFLFQFGAVAALAGLGPVVASASTLAPSSGSSSVCDRFRALLNQSFVLRDPAGDAEVKVRLTAVEDRPLQAGLEQFTLHFDGADGPRLPEGLYRVRSKAMQSFDLFVSPAGADDGPTAYRAVFSLLT